MDRVTILIATALFAVPALAGEAKLKAWDSAAVKASAGVKYRATIEATASQGEWLLAVVDPAPWMVNEDDGHDGYGRLGRCPAPHSIDPALMMWVHIGEAADLEASWRFAEARSARADDRRAWVRVLNETHPDTGWCVLEGITVWDRKE